MRYEDDQQMKEFQVCGSRIGWFCCCEGSGESLLRNEVGLGIDLYFKTMKQLVIFFVLCTLLSIPSFIFFASGADTPSAWQDSKSFFSSFTLGNLGQSSMTCSHYDFANLATEST